MLFQGIKHEQICSLCGQDGAKTCHGDGAGSSRIQDSQVHLWCLHTTTVLQIQALRADTYVFNAGWHLSYNKAIHESGKRIVSEGAQGFVVLSKVADGCSQIGMNNLNQDRSTLSWKYTQSHL